MQPVLTLFAIPIDAHSLAYGLHSKLVIHRDVKANPASSSHMLQVVIRRLAPSAASSASHGTSANPRIYLHLLCLWSTQRHRLLGLGKDVARNQVRGGSKSPDLDLSSSSSHAASTSTSTSNDGADALDGVERAPDAGPWPAPFHAASYALVWCAYIPRAHTASFAPHSSSSTLTSSSSKKPWWPLPSIGGMCLGGTRGWTSDSGWGRMLTTSQSLHWRFTFPSSALRFVFLSLRPAFKRPGAYISFLGTPTLSRSRQRVRAGLSPSLRCFMDGLDAATRAELGWGAVLIFDFLIYSPPTFLAFAFSRARASGAQAFAKGACAFNGISDSFRAGDRLRAADDAHEFRRPMFHLGGQNVFYNRDDAGERGLAAMTVVQKVVYTWPGQLCGFLFLLLYISSYPLEKHPRDRTTLLPLLRTFGGNFESDGRSTGTLDIKTVQCDTTAQTCTLEVPTPGFAHVFLTDDGAAGRQRATRQSPTANPSLLATSNDYRMSESSSQARGSLPAPPRARRRSGRVPLWVQWRSARLG
ncbi:hypothetical protein B0H13DRAFT_2387215 [Mycena leptocephala]|nr:hypothetical protein B0H13DRAFT_2387215 [Mycena leptocephala]